MAAGKRSGDVLHADGAAAAGDLRDASERTDRLQVPDQPGHAGGLPRRLCSAAAAGDLSRDQAAGGGGVKGQKRPSPLLKQTEEGGG